MICVGIDVAKDKYDCFILSSEGEVLADVFTIPNNAEGFDTLLQTIRRCARPEDKIKVGLEATGHYSYNILGFLLNEGLDTYVINPLHTNLYRKSLSLRKTKTDRVDARTIAAMLMSDVDLKSYTDTAYHNEELKSLTSKTLTAEKTERRDNHLPYPYNSHYFCRRSGFCGTSHPAPPTSNKEQNGVSICNTETVAPLQFRKMQKAVKIR